jgi:hypothetical protein
LKERKAEKQKLLQEIESRKNPTSAMSSSSSSVSTTTQNEISSGNNNNNNTTTTTTKENENYVQIQQQLIEQFTNQWAKLNPSELSQGDSDEEMEEEEVDEEFKQFVSSLSGKKILLQLSDPSMYSSTNSASTAASSSLLTQGGVNPVKINSDDTSNASATTNTTTTATATTTASTSTTSPSITTSKNNLPMYNVDFGAFFPSRRNKSDFTASTSTSSSSPASLSSSSASSSPISSPKLRRTMAPSAFGKSGSSGTGSSGGVSIGSRSGSNQKAFAILGIDEADSLSTTTTTQPTPTQNIDKNMKNRKALAVLGLDLESSGGEGGDRPQAHHRASSSRNRKAYALLGVDSADAKLISALGLDMAHELDVATHKSNSSKKGRVMSAALTSWRLEKDDPRKSKPGRLGKKSKERDI